MIQTKYNNFYEFIGTGNTFNIKFGKSTRAPLTYHEEICWNAKYIEANKSGKIHILYSGGIDSEYVLRIFLSLGIEFVPVIINLKPNLNRYDFLAALSFCDVYNLKPIIIDIDFEQYVTSGKFLERAKSSQCIVYQLTATMEATLKLDGTVLLGELEPHFYKDLNNGMWYFDERERVLLLWDRWFKTNNICGTPSILNYTPETLLAFMNDKLIVDLINNRISGKKGSNSSKLELYNRVFKDIPARKKLTGYETIEKMPLFQHPDIQQVKSNPFDNNLDGNGYFKIKYDDLKSHLESY